MPTIQVKSEVSLNELLNGVEQLSTPDLEYFVSRVLALQARRRVPSLPKNEAALLQEINRGVPPDIQQRFDALNEKRQAEILTPEEHQDLLDLIDHIEQIDVQRVEYMAQLAQLRSVSLREVMKQLNIHPRANV